MRLVYVFVIVLYLFVCFQKTRCQSNPAQRKQNMKSLPSPKTRDQAVTMVLQIKKLYRVYLCDRNTSLIACNEHIQTVMGQQEVQNLSHDWPNVEPILWAKDGPMSKRYVGPFKIYNHGPIVQRPMGQ